MKYIIKLINKYYTRIKIYPFALIVKKIMIIFNNVSTGMI
jgi:hypothetical protein